MQTIKLNLIPGGVLPVVNVSQYDVGRQFAIQVYEGAASYNLTGKSVQIRGTKPDGNGFAYDSADGAISVSGNTVTVTTLQQMTACGGDTTVELRITASGVVLGTLNFILAVEASALSDDTPISDTDIPAIERDFQAALDEAEADALKAEGHAQGTQDGEAVGSSSPYYHNNAKYYKEQADIDATNAGNSATNAAADALKSEGYAIGKQNGTAVQSGSPYYQNNAQYFDTHASEQAYNASQSANSASGSATSANTNALKSEGFAVGKQNGTAVSSDSPYYHNNAEYYRDQAAQYAAGGLHFMASVAFASIPITGMVNGDMYNITDSFTTDSRFVEGSGIAVSAGTNIAWVDSVSKWDILAPGGGSGSLSGLSDVTITSATSGQALVYDGAKWVNDTVSTVGDLDDLSDVSITSAADGDLLQYNSTSQEWENSADIPNQVAAVRDNGAVNHLWHDIVTQVVEGVTYTVNSDKTITASATGARINNSSIYRDYANGELNVPLDKTLRFTASPAGDGSNIVALIIVKRISDNTHVGEYYTSGGVSYVDFIVPSGCYISGLYIVVKTTANLSSPITFKPMISPAALNLSYSDYQPYAMTNRELTEAVTKNDFGESQITITSYTNTPYECPKDGYIILSGDGGAVSVYIFGAKNNNRIAPFIVPSGTYLSTLVRKGMRIKVISAAGSSKVAFLPLTV